MKNETSLFVVSLVGMTLSASVLIVLIPALFRSVEQGEVWAAGAAGCLAVAFAVGTRRWRPPGSTSDES